MRIATWLRRSSFAAAATLLVLALVAPSVVNAVEGDDPDAGRPPVFDGRAFTSAVHANINTDPPQTVPEIIRIDLPHGQSNWAAGTESRARAASVWPGLTVAEGGTLINQVYGPICGNGFPCDDFPLPKPPPWPLKAEAEYPNPQDSTADVNGERFESQPLSFTPHVVEAHAGRDYVETVAITTDVSMLDMGDSASAIPGNAGDNSLVHVGKAIGTTRHEFQDDVVVAIAESELEDVTLFGGAVHIDTISTRSESRADGADVLVSKPEVTVAGVTVLGQRAELTKDGLVVNGEKLEDQGGLSAVTTVLESFWSDGENDLRLVDAGTGTTEDGATTGDAVGVLLHARLDLGLQSMIVDVVLGTSSTAARASLTDTGDDFGFDDDFNFDDDFGGLGGPADDVDGGDFGGFADVAGEQVAFDGFQGDGGTSAAPVGTPPVTQTRAFPLELLSGVAANRMEILYAAWGLAVLGLALGSRLRPLRLSD